MTCNKIIDLTGEWEFTYTRDFNKENPVILGNLEFDTKVPVPGLWDENIEYMMTSPFWRTAKFNSLYRKVQFPITGLMPDASFLSLVGTGWYRKEISGQDLPVSHNAILHIGGVLNECWVWLNRTFISYHSGHSTPFEIALDKVVIPGSANELIIAVSNDRTDRSGCILRGYNAFSGGIYRPVILEVNSGLRLKNLYVQRKTSGFLDWSVDIEGEASGRSLAINWSILDDDGKNVLGSGRHLPEGNFPKWQTEDYGMDYWSDTNPKTYQLSLELCENSNVLYTCKHTFGLRNLKSQGTQLLLNGKPVMLRGVTEHCYFPETCFPPLNIEAYKDIIRKLKQLGFNWIRFHTWVPPEEYLKAADELGMMLQVEAPVGFNEQEWMDILYSCRKHPSVVIYCCGNEELLDEKKINSLGKMAALCHEIVPDALLSPQEALRGVEYYYDISNMGTDYEKVPFVHNRNRLEKLKEFSDVFGQYAWGLLSYKSVYGDRHILDERMKIYEKPCLSHEIGIHGGYLDLGLEWRYENTRIGTDLFAAVRKYLVKEGLLEKAALYYNNSCAWQRILRKHCVETARKCEYLAGYDFLGPIDQHWHRTGYPTGIMNEFYELKPGESIKNILKYNSENVLLLDNNNNRNLYAGDKLELDAFASLYGAGDIEDGLLSWYLEDHDHHVFYRGSAAVHDLKAGGLRKLAAISLSAPAVQKPVHVKLCMRLSGGRCELENDWDYWVFPEPEKQCINVSVEKSLMPALEDKFTGLSTIDDNDYIKPRVVGRIDNKTCDFLKNGGTVLLLGGSPFEQLPLTFQLSVAGRAEGNLATVIADHPLMNGFPHDGYCDWQFYSMIEGGSAVVFNNLNTAFKPILEVVSSFKWIKKQAAIFELNVGKGRLLVCTLNMKTPDPAAAYLLKRMLVYLESEKFKPVANLRIEELAGLMGINHMDLKDFTTDNAFDVNVQV